jgi:hypothetical protein
VDGSHLFTSDGPIIARHVVLEQKVLSAEVTAVRSTALRTTAGIQIVEPGTTPVALALGRP